MVVDAVIFHWVTLVMGEEVGPYGFGCALQLLATFFYTVDGFLSLTRPDWIQAALDVLAGMFDRVVLQNNVDKTVRMLCQPCYIVGENS